MQAGNDEEAQQDLLNASECYKKKRAWFSAAKALEQVITICLKKKPNSGHGEKGALITLTSTINRQISQAAAYQEQVDCKTAPEEVKMLASILSLYLILLYIIVYSDK